MSNFLHNLTHSAQKDLNAVIFNLGHALGFAHTPAEHEQQMHASPEVQALFDVKKSILDQVRADATANGEPRPTLEAYRIACDEFARTDAGKAMVGKGEWKPAIYADLSGQDLSGYGISEPKKISATKELELATAEKEAADKKHSTPDTVDIHDRDGDGQINCAPVHDFYNHIRFDKADLHGAWVEPATSFNEEIAKAGNTNDMTFSGMRDGDSFTFGAGKHENEHLLNVDGGEIIFAKNSQTSGVSIDGKTAKITIEDHAAVDNIAVGDHFRIIKLDMGKNSVLSNSDLGDSIISMHSQFAHGATFKNVNLGGNTEGLDLSGLKLINCSIEGKPITDVSQLSDHGISYDAHTVATATVQQPATEQQVAPAAEVNPLDHIRATMQQAVQSIGKPLNEQEMGILQQIALANQTRAENARDFTPPMQGGNRA